ncbi:MAG: hypothetical protein AB7F22_02775 [Reyranella sp.]|uniref:hypothetical protein n=1 Tax=Reyranella sp. TaxID=1929291 RepID=UPI003D0F18AD
MKDPRFKVVKGGPIDLYEDMLRDDPADRALYAPHVPKQDPQPGDKFAATTPKARYGEWRTRQMSDHAPLWIEIESDFADGFLRDIAEGNGRPWQPSILIDPAMSGFAM